MSANQVDGLKEALRALREIDPALRKEFTENAKRIGDPIVQAAKSNYNDSLIPSGTRRRWVQRGRNLFPFTTAKARSGVKVQVKQQKIAVVQTNPAAAIYEFAGNSNSLGRAFSARGRQPARVMWPAADSKVNAIQNEMKQLLEAVERYIQKGLD